MGAPCGLMDQLACSLGAPGRALPIVCRPDAVGEPVGLPPTVAVVGWPSGVKHALSGAASPYLVARTAAFMAKKALERAPGGRPLAHLTELRPSELARAAPASLPASMTGAAFLAAHGGVDDALSRVEPGTAYPLAAAAAFPVGENFRCELALALLRGLAASRAGPGEPAYADALAAVGELMYQAHEGYSSVGLGCAETDAMVDALRGRIGRAGGVWGARISGGGNGGTVAVLCERAALPALEALAKELTFGEPFPGFIE